MDAENKANDRHDLKLLKSIVLDYFGHTDFPICRKKEYVRAKQVFCYLAYELLYNTNESKIDETIANYIGNNYDRCSVLHSIDVITNEVNSRTVNNTIVYKDGCKQVNEIRERFLLSLQDNSDVTPLINLLNLYNNLSDEYKIKFIELISK